jgi:hypothetical protein
MLHNSRKLYWVWQKPHLNIRRKKRQCDQQLSSSEMSPDQDFEAYIIRESIIASKTMFSCLRDRP